MSDRSFRGDSHLRESFRSQDLKNEDVPYNRLSQSYQQPTPNPATGGKKYLMRGDHSHCKTISMS